jgi:glycosyltransferase involved in cell wall biosynthesis
MAGLPSLVSIVVSVRDQERHAEAALESAYEQDHDAVEIVVVDDGSQDRTASVVRNFMSQTRAQSRFRRIMLIEHEASLGASAAINRGLHEARGEYISLLNGDERFVRGRVSALLDACTRAGGELAFSRVEPIVDDAAVASSAELEHVYSVQDNIEFFPTVGYALLRNQCALSTGNLFFSRALFERVGDFANLNGSHGWQFLLRSVLLTEPIFVPEPLYRYRLLGHERFLQQQTGTAAETDRVLRDYFFLCRNRPLENPVAPSPAWGPFFMSFVEASRLGRYLAQP